MNKNDFPLYREIIVTKDGSHSFYVPSLDETYHSSFGAAQEANHIFIKDALAWRAQEQEELNILEIGFGTGLNALLSMKYAQENYLSLYYFGIEKYPITEAEFQILNYVVDSPILQARFQKLHHTEWGSWNRISDCFTLFKLHSDFRKMNLELDFFDVVYFDAFGPDVQPDLWTEAIFSLIFNSMRAKGVMTSYSVKGKVRRAMEAVGFNVAKIPGPLGKREITRAIKPVNY